MNSHFPPRTKKSGHGVRVQRPAHQPGRVALRNIGGPRPGPACPPLGSPGMPALKARVLARIAARNQDRKVRRLLERLFGHSRPMTDDEFTPWDFDG